MTRPSKEPTADKWHLCLCSDDYPNRSVKLACFPRKPNQLKGDYPLWYALASRYPQWEVYRAKDGSDRWWIQDYQYGQRHTLIKDAPFLAVGAWYAKFMREDSWTAVHFIYEEVCHE